MRVEVVGDGEPEIAVVGGIHGDEPCGVRAVERLLAADLAVQRPVKFVVANQEAIERDRRYVDEDLNRAFPGDPDGPTHEARLASELADELSGMATLSMHSTQSYAEPFAICDGVGDFEREVAPQLSVAAVVDAGDHVDGRLFEVLDRGLEVECGLQGSQQAAENAVRLTKEFLTVMGVLAGDTVLHEVEAYRLVQRIPKTAGDVYEVFAENFERVDSGSAFAAADGQQIVAEEDFYPVLLSAYGYEDVFGYAAEYVGTLGTVTRAD